MTPAARALLPEVELCWAIFEAATATVSTDAGVQLAGAAERAIAALNKKSFAERIAEAAAKRPPPQA